MGAFSLTPRGKDPQSKELREGLALQIEKGAIAMTELLQQAFAEAAKLPEREQEVLAARLIAELAVEDDFDRAIANSSEKLAAMAQRALAEFRAGKTEAADVNRP